MRRTFHPDRAFHDVPTTNPLPPLTPYQRCRCGKCRDCQENAKWDRIFAKFETKTEERGVYQSALNNL